MKDSNNRLFLGLTALFGTVGAILRVVLLRTAIDEKGLLIPSHFANLGLWAVSILFVLLTWVLLKKKLGDNGSFSDVFPKCRIRFGLSAAAAAVLAVESLRQLGLGQKLPGILGLLAALGMAGASVSRLKGSRPLPLFHILVCVFFIARLVLSFQGWSADPQFQDYSMQLLASVSLMLFSFHRASCDAKLMDREATARYSLLSAGYCLISLSDPTMPLLYTAGALWSIGAGPNLQKLEEPAQETEN